MASAFEKWKKAADNLFLGTLTVLGYISGTVCLVLYSAFSACCHMFFYFVEATFGAVFMTGVFLFLGFRNISERMRERAWSCRIGGLTVKRVIRLLFPGFDTQVYGEWYLSLRKSWAGKHQRPVYRDTSSEITLPESHEPEHEPEPEPEPEV